VGRENESGSCFFCDSSTKVPQCFDYIDILPAVYYVGIRQSHHTRTFCERGFDSPLYRPHVKDIFDLLIGTNCPAGRSIGMLTQSPSLHQLPLFVGTADVPESIDSPDFDSDRNNFQELGRLSIAISSMDNRFLIEPLPASEQRTIFLQTRRLNPSTQVFVLYIYEEVTPTFLGHGTLTYLSFTFVFRLV
jgi:hypothetical protein